MKQTIEIEVPDGKVAVWEDGKVMFKDVQPLPKTWDEFKKLHLNNVPSSLIIANFAVLPKSIRGQYIALIQLHQLRDCYRRGWVSKSEAYDAKWCICLVRDDELEICDYYTESRFLSFPTKELAEEFLNNFRDLIEQAGDLI